MTVRRRRGFTIIELLVVISIISILLGILLPALSAVRIQSQQAVCMQNLGNIGLAFTQYRQDWNDVLPGNFPPVAVSAAAASLGTIKNNFSPNWYDAVGNITATNIDTDYRPAPAGPPAAPIRMPPLNRYMNDNEDVAKCPLDKGTPEHATASHAWEAYGSSYVYPDRTAAQIAAATPVFHSGILAPEGLRGLDISNPEKKMLIADQVVLANGTNARDEADDVNHWHNSKDPLRVSMVFADGHTEIKTRKTGGEATSTDLNTIKASNKGYY